MEFRECDELKDLTPMIIRTWNSPIKGKIYLVRKQVLLRCPECHEYVDEPSCNDCIHNFGSASGREIYCLPDMERPSGIRVNRRKERKEK